MAKKTSNTVRNIFNIATIISITITALKLGLAGKLTAEQIAVLLIVCVIILALRSNVVKVIAALASLYLFAQTYASNSREFEQIIAMVLTLAGMMVGIYIIFGGWRKRK